MALIHEMVEKQGQHSAQIGELEKKMDIVIAKVDILLSRTERWSAGWKAIASLGAGILAVGGLAASIIAILW